MDKHLDNKLYTDGPELRRPGRPKGSPKPANSGRRKGSPNKAIQDVREAARAHGQKALKKLVELIANPDALVALAASREILDRAYGRPVTPATIAGTIGTQTSGQDEPNILELARLTVFLLSKAEHESEMQSAHALPATIDQGTCMVRWRPLPAQSQ